jgi:hypothetical protein
MMRRLKVSMIDRRSFQYSTTGEVFWAWRTHGRCSSSPTKQAEILGLDLTSLKLLWNDPAPVGMLVIGSGDRVLLSTDATLLCLDSSAEPPTTLWSVSREQEVRLGYSSMKMLDDKHVAWSGIYGRISIVDIRDGRLVYVYDPLTLAETEPEREDGYFFRSKLIRGPDAGTVTLFDRINARTRTLDLESGKLSTESADIALPGEPFELGTLALPQGRLFLISPNEVRIKPVR